MNSTTHKTGGLADVIAGQTAISTVGQDGVGLTYRGYSIEDLAHQSTFEEVAYLLIYGHLPNPSELESYQNQLGSLRGLPATLRTILEQLPSTTHPMDVLRTGCSVLGNLEPESNDYLKSLMRTTSRVTSPETRMICLPSGDQS